MAGEQAVHGYPQLRFAGGATNPAEQHISTRLLAALEGVAQKLGAVIVIFSGSGGPNVRHAGFAGDPHSQGVAVDATINGQPIGNYRGAVAALHAAGLRTGATDFTYQGNPDPAHVDLLYKGGGGVSAKQSTGQQSSTANALVQFVVGVSKATGLDPRVIVAWVKAEGAYAPSGTGGYNFLNLRPQQGDPYSSVSSGGFEQFPNVQAAITATTHRLSGSNYAGIRAAKGKTPGQAIAAIAASPWDSGHYGGPGGPKLAQIFGQLFGGKAGLGSSYQGPDTAAAVASTAAITTGGTGSAADAGSYDAKNAAGDAAAAASGALDWFGSLQKYAIRAAEVVGGFLLILVGMALVARQLGAQSPIPVPSAVPVPV